LPGRALIQNECRVCVDSSLTVSSVFLAIGLAIAWYIFAWRPVFEKSKYKLHPLHVMLYLPMKLYWLLRRAIKACVTRRPAGDGRLRDDKQKTEMKGLQTWFMSVYNVAKERGAMSYTKVRVCMCV
jgi:hypothetical protein